MSETKFTPGPWFADGIFVCDNDDSNVCVCEQDNWEPDSYLIAAAPDMFEELECARDVFRFYQSHHEFKGGTEKAIRNKEIADRIDRLLAKARGEG